MGHCLVISTFVAWLLLFAFVASLAVSKVYIYDVDLRHAHKAECIILECKVTDETCYHQVCTGTTSNSHCTLISYACYGLHVNLQVQISGNTYEGDSFVTRDHYPRTCEGNTTTCYYDDRKIIKSLTLNANGPIKGGIIAIVVFSIVSFLLLLVVIAVTVYCCTKERPFEGFSAHRFCIDLRTCDCI